tara:strand:- start:6 stop:572 length:567 start_codon:yes stop_codon:yes gene_type:complete
MGKTEYKNRNEILEELGYDDYTDYLKSKLWAEIRDRVLKESGYECICCANRSISKTKKKTLVMQVHHMVYTKENLSGESLYGLVAICQSCHVKAEFKPRAKTRGKRGRRRKQKMGAKKTLGEANSHVLGIGKNNKKKKKKTPSQFYLIKPKCKICKLESDNRKEICTYCENREESMSLKWLGNQRGID